MRTQILSIAALGVVIALALNGGGRRAVYITPQQYTTNRKLSFAQQLIYVWAITMVKISIASFLLRLSPHRYYIRFLKLCKASLILATVCATLVILLQCQPVALAWDKSLKGSCWPASTLAVIWYTINGAEELNLPFFA